MIILIAMIPTMKMNKALFLIDNNKASQLKSVANKIFQFQNIDTKSLIKESKKRNQVTCNKNQHF